MRSTKIKSMVICILIMGMTYSLGCIFNPKPDVDPPPVDPVDWPDLTAKEDVIEYLLLTYKHRAEKRYEDLLHPQYIWYMQERDAEELGIEMLDYAQDVRGTTALFNRAVLLELDIETGTWVENTGVGEVPCEGCWENESTYTIRVQLPGNETIFYGNDHVKFIVVPVQEDGKTKYKIRWAYDIPM